MSYSNNVYNYITFSIYVLHNNIYLYLFVTSAQREGSLSEATSVDTDQSDPFYAHCKFHIDKLISK